MISRIQNRIFQQLNNSCQKYFSSVVNFENCSSNLKNERLKENDIPQFNKTEVEKKQNFIIDEDGFVTVYTDGSCTFNGHEEKARAGIGVWFGDNHPLNISAPIVGRSTCNVAEIVAATKAVKAAKEAGIKKLKLHSDSNYVVQSVTAWMPKWKTNGWKSATKKPVINKDELMKLDEMLSSIEVSWVHVPSHSGIHGNEMANILAKRGIDMSVE
ncbi:ribonuclease H1-like [Leptopilina heterotoma]|uniref:ribonuclease H1-like n=1 Tax=Leptopilina heterotoma TaxID=63436 RepID=UPI001CA85B16|nr:ribonuclease H1-like [Leptopilina heterotoma]